MKKLTLLTNYTEYEQKLLIEAAIKCLLLFYIIFDSGKPIVLDNGEVERIRLNHPEGVYLNFQNTNEYEDNIQNKIQYIEKYGWGSMWIDSEKADEYLDMPRPDKLSYSSPLINILLIAEKKFWHNFDPEHPPKSEEIVSYLINDHKLSIKNAKEIDSIIRPEVYKSGGNRRRNKI
ncbi:hypothetical protein GH742_00905 [Legionella sp. MW5194]|uniref:hypothetical protein n=1 Tax=Legionella sp. MW5194 TaxID=2662448 RepID=UPI00193E2ED7|nr:hypothetical protein [Legionella sp. MW5194]QRN02548.1 hypothetical protein GH742_00905 [Legionella sp. MW5194]